MSNDHVPHVIRTAEDPRQEGMHTVTLSKIKEINNNIRVIRLTPNPDAPPIVHSPGQWLDLHIPTVSQVGGFTVTSPPSTAIYAPLNRYPYLELAVQRSANNPPAAYLWHPVPEIRGSQLQVRVGGSFVYPPPTLSKKEVSGLKRAVFVAGGVGINPLMSMLTFISEVESWPESVWVFYSVRLAEEEALSSVLFFDRIRALGRDARTWGINFHFRFIVTSKRVNGSNGTTVNGKQNGNDEVPDDGVVNVSYGQRLQWEELREAIGDDQQRKEAVVYVCGPSGMTDEIVERMKGEEGVEERRVLCEKWW